MKTVLVLGGTGMLGSMVTDDLSRSRGLRVTATYRPTGQASRSSLLTGVQWISFDASAGGVEDSLAACGQHDWIINAIGITKPLIRDDNSEQINRAIRINALLPQAIAEFARGTGARVLQIATDCVYSGAKGSYIETDPHDALDVYGKTKSLGECYEPNMSHLRCSIIGPEPKGFKFLIEWFRSQPTGGRVNGYLNHRWNGITTLHFARVCKGIIEAEPVLPHVQHIVPAGPVSKAQILHEFAAAYDRHDIAITDIDASSVIDRTLATLNPDINAQLWQAAGYPKAPTVAEMITEVASYDYRFGNRQNMVEI
jgi:dTDP-4-dehydrorhamnose reductase